MADIRHLVTIDAPVGAVYLALTRQEGLAGWWTTDTVAKPEIGSTAEFRFGERHHNIMRVDGLDLDSRVSWTCLVGDTEWVGTTLEFRLEHRDGATIVRFCHGNWREKTDFFASCNYHWGFYMRSLKLFCETGTGTPHCEG